MNVYGIWTWYELILFPDCIFIPEVQIANICETCPKPAPTLWPIKLRGNHLSDFKSGESCSKFN